VAALPAGVSWSGIALIGCVAGIGFTMAIFVAGLAFPEGGPLGVTTLGVLAASTIAAVGGLGLGRFLMSSAGDERRNTPAVAAGKADPDR
jgi:NhaA family Na+:H+ antiporter